jgi:hypothetical protein
MSYFFDDASQLDIYQNSAESQKQEGEEVTEVKALEWSKGRIPLGARRANFP